MTTPESVVFWVAFIGLLLGIATRLALPFIRKLKDGTIDHWEFKYTLSAAASLLFTLIVGFLAIGTLTVPDVASAQVTADFAFKVVAANFLVGFGMTSLINEVTAMGSMEEKPK
jgi:hypothetical protein